MTEEDLLEISTINKNLDMKISLIDNTTNKNLERVERLEEEIRLIKEREKRRETGAIQKFRPMNSNPRNNSEPIAGKPSDTVNKDKDDIKESKWFLPHFPIFRPEKATTKIQIVFYGSAKFNDICLIDDV